MAAKQLLVLASDNQLMADLQSKAGRFDWAVTASCVEDLLERARQIRPSVVICDTGIKATPSVAHDLNQTLKLLNKPVVYLTSDTDPKLIHVNDHERLAKPFNSLELFSSVYRACHRYSQRQRCKETQPENSELGNGVEALVLLNKQGVICYIDSSNGFLFGREDYQWVGAPWYELIHFGDAIAASEIVQQIQSSIATESDYYEQYDVVIQVDQSSFSLVDLAIESIGSDATNTAAVAILISQSSTSSHTSHSTDGPKTHLENVGETVCPVAMFHTDAKGCCTWVNEKWVELIGKTFIEVAHCQWFSVLAIQQKQEIERQWRHAVRQKVGGAFQFSISKIDATSQWFLVKLVAEHSATGELRGYVGVVEDITNLVQAETAKRQSEKQFRSLLVNTPEAVLIFDVDKNQFVEVNENACTLLLVDEKTLLGLDFEAISVEKQTDGSVSAIRIAELIKSTLFGETPELDWKCRNGAGQEVACYVRFTKLPGSGKLIRASIQDISAQLHSDKVLAKLNRVLDALTACNNVLIRAEDETALLNDICRIVTEIVGYQMAWVGLAQYDSAKSVLPVAHFGNNDGFLERANISWSDSSKGRGPTGTCVRTGKAIVTKNILTAPEYEPWRKQAYSRGFCSVAAIPLKSEHGVIGALSIYAGEPDAFDKEEMHLLSGLAKNMAFGIASLRAKEARRLSESALLKSKAEFEAIYNSISDAVIFTDADGYIVRINPAVIEQFGYAELNLVGKNLDILFAKDMNNFEQEFNIDLQSPLLTDAQSKEIICCRSDGGQFIGEYTSSNVSNQRNEVLGRIAVIRDITERKRAQKRIENSESELSGIISSLQDIYYRTDAEGRIVRIAGGLYETLGYQPEEVLGAYVRNFYRNPADRDRLLNILAQNGGVAEHFESQLLHKNGRSVWVSTNVHWAKGQDGKIIGTEGIARDVTELKRIEDAQRRLGKILDHSHNEVYIIDAHTLRFIQVSRSSLRNLGYTMEEMLGMTPTDIMPYLSKAEFSEMVESLGHEEEKQLVVEQTYQRRDGSHYDVELRLQYSLDDIVPVYVATVLDISQRRQAEAKQKRYAQRLKILNDIGGEILAAQSMHAIAEAAMQRIGELIRNDLASIVLSEERNESYNVLVTHGLSLQGFALGKKVAINDIVAEFPSLKSGDLLYFGEISDVLAPSIAAQKLHQEQVRSLMYVPLLVQSELIGVLVLVSQQGFAFDDESQEIALEIADLLAIAIHQAHLHERVKQHANELEQRVHQRTAELAAANKELETFSYSVSHDLRAPLRAIDGFSQALFEDYGDQLDSEAMGYLRRVRSSTLRMGELIDDLLVLSRVTRHEIRQNKVCLSELAQEIMRNLKTLNPNRTVSIVIMDGIEIEGDDRLFRILLENLLGNAWKFTAYKDPAIIQFGLEYQSDTAVLFVRDNGAGFDSRYADKLFQPFQRLHSAQEFEGTGVGLAIVDRIIKRHAGHVWTQSTPGEGTTIYFTFSTEAHVQAVEYTAAKIS